MTGPPRAAPRVVTEAHDGATLALGRGLGTVLRLSNGWRWDEPQVTGGAIQLAPVQYLTDPGYVEWSVAGVRAGTAEVMAAGWPNCAEDAECPPRNVTVRFVVED